MKTTHNIVKYFAIALAISIIVSIVSSLYFALKFIFPNNYTKEENNEVIVHNYDEYEINSLEIKLSNTNLYIKEGNGLKVETNTGDLDVFKENDKLKIKDKRNLFNNLYNKKLIIYIPNLKKFNDVLIDGGAGKINIENINTKELDLDLGVGSTTINGLIVSKDAKIKGGAGELNLNKCSINNLNLNLGVGNTKVFGKLKEESKINTGIGNFELILDEIEDSYKIKVEKGIGSVTINNKIFNDSIYGNGENYIDIDGGIGNINISFKTN